MSQSPTLLIKNKNNSTKSNLITTKKNNDVSNDHRTTQPNNNKSTSTNSIHAIDKMDTTNNDNSCPDGWTLTTTNKMKRIHSSSSEFSTPPIKNKKLFSSSNRYEVLSQDDLPSAPPSGAYTRGEDDGSDRLPP